MSGISEERLAEIRETSYVPGLEAVRLRELLAEVDRLRRCLEREQTLGSDLTDRLAEARKALMAYDVALAERISYWNAKGPMNPAQELRDLRAALAASTTEPGEGT